MKKKNLVPTKIDPHAAASLLEKHYKNIAAGNFKQRHISEAAVTRYALDMRAGNWLFTPAPIVLDQDGNVIDGQHRLEAVIKSKTEQNFLIYRDWKDSKSGPRIIDVLDSGKPRSTGDKFRLDGEKNVNALVSAANYISQIAAPGKKRVLTYSATKKLLFTFGLKDNIDRIISMVPNRKMMGRIVGPIAFVHTFRKNKAEQFLSDYKDCAGARNSPVSLFIQYERNNPHYRSEAHFLALCSALRAHVEGSELQNLHPNRQSIEFLRSKNPDLVQKIRGLVTIR